MIDLTKYDLFQENRAALKELSRDNSNPSNVQYMTESQLEAVDFDTVKRKYTNRQGLSEETAASVDAVIQDSGGILFIEFKNGKVKNRNVKDKIRDSLLIFCDITNKTISCTRENACFVLVYNQSRNPLPNQITKGRTQESPSRTAIAKHFLNKAGQEYILFDLERYQTLYFKEVHTYSQEEFEDFLKKRTEATEIMAETAKKTEVTAAETLAIETSTTARKVR